MKKITLLFFILTTYIGYSQATHTIDFEPAGVGNGWSWTATEVAPSFAVIANPVSGGINTSATVVEFIANPTDQPWALVFTDDNLTFTFDATNSIVKIMVYKSRISDVGIKFEGVSAPIEKKVPNTLINQWEEITIDFTDQIGNTYNRLVVLPDFAARTTTQTLYFDNIQVPEGEVVESCSDGIMNQDETGIDCGGVCAPCATLPPNAAPTPPNRAPEAVRSIFSDAYANIAVDTFDTPWCGATTTDATVGGNPIKKVSNLGCEGVEFITGRFDATSMTHFHIDIFTNTPTMDKSFNVKFSNWNGGTAEANAIEKSFNNGSTPALPNTNPGTWISFDIPLSSFTPINGSSRNDLVQFIITSDLGTVYYDNLYLHNNTVLGINEFDTASFNVFPNPAKDSWTVKTQNTTMNSIDVFDMVGKNVLSITPNSSETSIDGSNLKTGLYFARINTNGNVNTVKLIKN